MYMRIMILFLATQVDALYQNLKAPTLCQNGARIKSYHRKRVTVDNDFMKKQKKKPKATSWKQLM